MVEKVKLDYELLSLEPNHAHFRFQGVFMGEPVTWDVNLYTLAVSGDGSCKQTMKIEVGAREKTVNAELYLAITKVTEAEILKSIIMIRNYKKLKPGVHEWTG